MRVAVECLQRILFDWCSGMISIMRKKLSNCKRGCKKKFGCENIMVVFFFEIVPTISPAVALPPPSPLHSRLTRWGDVFLHESGGGSIQNVYDDDLYLWWERKVPALEQFPYAGLEFREDNDLVLPPREAWGEIGIFIFLCYLIFL